MKKYCFIGNMDDISTCVSMDKECIAVGCKGKIHGQCCFDFNLDLLPSGSDHYKEITDSSQNARM